MTNRSAVVISLGVILSVLALVAVLLRLQARRVKRVSFEADDWTIIAGLLFSWVISAAAIAGAVDGRIGHHIYDAEGQLATTFDQIVATGKALWIIQWNSALGPGLTKISVVLLYKRIFAVPHGIQGNSFGRLCWLMIFVCGAWTIAFFFANLLGCLPISGNWTSAGTDTGNCVDVVKLVMTMVISDVIIDGLILTLPWIPLSKLQMRTSKKLMVAGIFLLGAFTVVAGIIRADALHEAITTKSEDYGYMYAPPTYWALIESNVGIISACLPCMGPIVGTSSVSSVIDRAHSAWSKIRSSSSSIAVFASNRSVSDEESLRHKSTSHSSVVDLAAEVPATSEKQITRTTTVTQDTVLRSANDPQAQGMFSPPSHVRSGEL